MSLKAKIEAVIYASEEPVTLPQLVSLLGEEAQAELDERKIQQQSLSWGGSFDQDPSAADPTGDEAGDPEALNAELLAGSEGEEAAGEQEPEVQPESLPGDAGPEDAAAKDEKQVAREAAGEAKLRERALREYFRELLDRLMAEYAQGDRGLEIREVAGGFRLATRPEYHDAVRGFAKSLKPALKLSLQALEALAVVAYKQPVTSPEVSEIRGVESAGVLGSLIARKLITTAGRKQVIGRPILYKTTKDFLLRFGLKDINELPSIEEFEKMAGELADAEPVQEEIQMESTSAAELVPVHENVDELMHDAYAGPAGRKHEPATRAEVEPMAEIHSAQADGTPDGSESPATGSATTEKEPTPEEGA